jgi:predicted CxxxxCH...CXXCH cytochrome family protein
MFRRLALTLLCLAGALGCQEQRDRAAPAVVYDGDVASLLRVRCVRCHGEDDAGADFRTDSYANTLGCPAGSPEQRAIDRGPDGRALLEVLKRSDHAKILSRAERATLERWVEEGAALRHSAVHAEGILNSRSRDWHGSLASKDHYAPLVRATDPGVCGRCHSGAPATPRGIEYPAPGATDCTRCHTQPEGVLACGTCHGDGAARAFPPRDSCLFGGGQPDAHRAHLESTRVSMRRLSCTTCHPAAGADLSGTHANGVIDVVFDADLAGADATYDRASGQCSVACHTRGGERANPTFHDAGPLGCNDCHRSPPEQHFAGACDRCHPGVNASGTGLEDVALHLDGRVELGDASGTCSACHGRAGDPMPLTASHELHRETLLTRGIACSDCHTVPSEVTSPGHLDRVESTPADVTFGERASAREQSPLYAEHTCVAIACHGAGLPEGIERALVWDTPASGRCSGCHGLPPSVAHSSDRRCAASICHGTEVSAGDEPNITEAGRDRHINGRFDVKAM